MGCAGSKGGSPVADESAAMMRARRGPRASVVSSQYKVETVKDTGAAEAQRLVASTGSLPLDLPVAGLHLRYAFLSQRGYYPDSPDKANQDAVHAAEGLGGNAGAAGGGWQSTGRFRSSDIWRRFRQRNPLHDCGCGSACPRLLRDACCNC